MKLRDLPSTLIFQKRSTQSFSDNQRVTLYYCDALKKYFSIAYDKSGFQLSENFIDYLNDTSILHFNDQSSIEMNIEAKNHIIELYNSLSEGHEEFITYISESDKNFLKILGYSIRKNT